MQESLNERAYPLIEDLIKNNHAYNIEIVHSSELFTILDCGINKEGSFDAGRIVSEILLANLGVLSFFKKKIGNYECDWVNVSVKNTVLATLGSQLAGWSISLDDFSAIASGPARALIQKPKCVFEKLNHRERSQNAILFLETNRIPNERVLEFIASKLQGADHIYILCAPLTSVVGSIQVSARVVESAVHKMMCLEYPLDRITFGEGRAPIAPLCNSLEEMMGRTNDAILYGSFVTLTMKDIRGIDIKKIPSSSSKMYKTPFKEIFRRCGDFYSIDPLIFAPAQITLKYMDHEVTHGNIDEGILQKSFGLKNSENMQI